MIQAYVEEKMSIVKMYSGDIFILFTLDCQESPSEVVLFSNLLRGFGVIDK